MFDPASDPTCAFGVEPLPGERPAKCSFNLGLVRLGGIKDTFVLSLAAFSTIYACKLGMYAS